MPVSGEATFFDYLVHRGLVTHRTQGDSNECRTNQAAEDHTAQGGEHAMLELQSAGHKTTSLCAIDQALVNIGGIDLFLFLFFHGTVSQGWKGDNMIPDALISVSVQ